jgi:16S rRNA (adenine1518-N6/adenine1519-N6)-dimethyltransferase
MSFLDARELLARHAQRPKKSWGQNFLVSERVFAEIVDACALSSSDVVVEIGAGLGTLTDRLAARAGRVVALERDREMAAILRSELGARTNIEIVEANALTFEYAERRPFKAVGNLPYHLSSQLLFRLLEAQPERMVLMFQREVGERILANENTEEYGALSVMVQLTQIARRVCRVPPSAFLPAPKVESVVLMLEPGPPRDLKSPELFSRLVHAAFGKRRKTLKNALGKLADSACLERANIDGTRRGETLSVDEFVALANCVSDAGAA